ncbi:VOC family protein [Candidatus Solirubrobacter pratensis]|uniref:VOC family protein n=1 Tax=Candidatus Solirubrobacter pratensis TaxID=1298857 RepID=UPI0003FC459F|nr:VOC family protein [Candidatus Solirubrobacter pratensis]
MTSPATTPALAATTRLRATHLTVSDLDRSLGFYQDAIGLRVHAHEDGVARLGAGGEDVLALHEDVAARPAGRHAGLYHVALLYPSREELAFAVDRLVRTRTPVEGMSDHQTHEAIYLPDPDGNGLELAADRPRSAWPAGLGYSGGPAPLDVEGLYSLARGAEVPRFVGPGFKTGHLHLHVSDLAAARDFYRDVIGFEVQFEMPTAAFLSAGGYHHHIAVNTWRGPGVPPVPGGGVAGMRHWTVVVTPEDLAAVAERAGAAPAGGALELPDPSGNVIRLEAS